MRDYSIHYINVYLDTSTGKTVYGAAWDTPYSRNRSRPTDRNWKLIYRLNICVEL